MRIAPHPHPPYSPDFTPSDFFFFGHLKDSLQARQFGSADHLLSAVRKILDEISVHTLEKGFREYINRLDQYIAALQQMESMWNEVNNGPLTYSWQCSSLEMLIPSWDTRCAPNGEVEIIIHSWPAKR
jgi:hypothetical protein